MGQFIPKTEKCGDMNKQNIYTMKNKVFEEKGATFIKYIRISNSTDCVKCIGLNLIIMEALTNCNHKEWKL